MADAGLWRPILRWNAGSHHSIINPDCRLLSTEHEATHCLAAEADHEHESTLLEDVSRLLGDVRASVRWSLTHTLSQVYKPLACLLAEWLSQGLPDAFQESVY